MFRETRKRRLRSRIIFAAIGVLILSFGIWLNQRESVDQQEIQAEQNAQSVVNKIKAEEDKKKAVQQANDSGREGETGTAGTGNRSEKTGTEDIPESYLIKEVDGVVKVFLCDPDGKKELYLITSIPFDLLSESDQQLFVDGV